MPGYDRESKNDGRESTAKGFAKEVRYVSVMKWSLGFEHCWVPLLGCHCWGLGGVAAHVGGLDVVPLLAAMVRCHCWAAIAGLPLLGAIAGDRGGLGVHVGGLEVVPLLAAVAACHCWAAIAGDRGGVGCTRWRIGGGAVAGCRCWLPLLRCHCWG